MLSCRGLAALLQQVSDTFPYVVHPFGLLGGSSSIHSERLGGRLDEPAIAQVAFIWHCVDGDALQRDDVLLIVLLLLNDDVTINQDVVEEEELPCLWLLAAEFSENTLTNQHTAWDGQWLTCSAEAALNHRNPLGVGLAVRKPVHHLHLTWRKTNRRKLRTNIGDFFCFVFFNRAKQPNKQF